MGRTQQIEAWEALPLIWNVVTWTLAAAAMGGLHQVHFQIPFSTLRSRKYLK
jgi:hypothetical protein